MIGHTPRHREPGPTVKMLRKVRWLRVMHPRLPAPSVVAMDAGLDPTCVSRPSAVALPTHIT
ncbi:hypothetical protein [Dactylosporangium sp. NPDC006015]|uniref:hypothetical protein n=1 Tax=Dactylosporangium sp. NPDC006015 TaxID=3154576 RepID=UPI0033AF0CD7